MYAKHDLKVGDFYACGSQWRENKRDRCTAPASILSSQIDPAVWSVVEAFLSEPQRLISHLEEMSRDENAGSLQPEVDKLDAEIGKLTTKVRNAFEELVSIEDADIKESLRGQITLWQRHLGQFKSDREMLLSRQRQWLSQQERTGQFVARLTDVSNALSSLDIDTKRDALDALGVKVRVYKAARKGPQEQDSPPRWMMTWDVPLSPDDVVNASRT